MFHRDNPHGLFWFPYSVHHQKVAAVTKRTLSKRAMANNNMEFPIVRQACFCLFVCLYMCNILASLFVYLYVWYLFAKVEYNRLTTGQTQFLNNWFCSTGTCSTSRPIKKRWADVFFTFEIIFSPIIAAQIVSLDCLLCINSVTIRICDIFAEVLIWIQFLMLVRTGALILSGWIWLRGC